MAYGFTYTLPTITGSHSNMPIVLKTADFPATSIDASGNAFANGGGDMMAYTSSAKTIQLPLEIVTFVSSATVPEAEVWVKIDTAATGGTIYLEADDIQTVQPAVAATYGRDAVHSAESFVFHMGQDPSGTAPQMVDSTGNQDATSQGMVSGDSISGKIGNELNFDGIDAAIVVPDSANLDWGTSDFTVSLWINVDSTIGTANGRVINTSGKGPGSSKTGFQLKVRDTGASTWEFYDTGVFDGISGGLTLSSGTSAFSFATDYRVSMRYDQSLGDFDVLVNGVVEETHNGSTMASMSSTNDLVIGASLYNNDVAEAISQLFKGTLDDIIGGANFRSDSYLATEYSNQNASVAWGTVGTYISTGAAINSVGGDDVVLDAEVNAAFVTTGFSSEISTVQLVSGTSITNATGVTSTSGAGDFDLPDITGYVVDTVGCPLTTANNIVVARLTDA